MYIRPRFIFFWLFAVWIIYLLFAGLSQRYGMIGNASWYGDEFSGKLTSSGDAYDPMKLTAAHRTLRLGTLARITHMKNGRSVIVKINDRGPFVDGRIIDLSEGAAEKLAMLDEGIAKVRIKILH